MYVAYFFMQHIFKGENSSMTKQLHKYLFPIFSCLPIYSYADSMTMYGRVDLGLRYSNKADYPDVARLRMQDSSNGILGFKGTEQLGNGLSSYFLLETNFHADTGQQDNNILFNDSYFGLHQDGLGYLRIGRMSSPIDNHGANGRTEAFGGDSYAGMGSRGAASLGKWNNTIMLQSDYYHGMAGEVTYSFGEGNQKNAYGAELEYQNDRLLIAVAWQKDSTALSDTTIKDDWTTTSVAGYYSFDTFTVMAVAAHSRGIASTDLGQENVYTVGAKIPVRAGELRASYQNLQSKMINGLNRDADIRQHRLGVGYYYPLSKLTSVSTSLVRNQLKQVNQPEQTGYGAEIALRKLF